MIFSLGRRLDLDAPLVDSRFPDGSRVNATIPPRAIDGPSITVGKFSIKKLTVENLIESGSLTPQISDQLDAAGFRLPAEIFKSPAIVEREPRTSRR